MSPTDDALDDPPQQGPKPFDPVKADAAAKAILAQGGQQADVDTYLQQTYGLTPHTSATAPAHDFHAEYASGALAKRMAAENAAEGTQPDVAPPTQPKPMGAWPSLKTIPAELTALSGAIPGATALQAAVRAGLRGQSYRDALRDIQGAQANLAPGEKTALNIAGASPLAALIPGSPMWGGAALGGAGGAFNAEPVGLGQRLWDTAKGAAIGGATGKALDLASTAGRALFAKSLGKNALERQGAMRAADATNYGRAGAEGDAAVAAERAPQLQFEAAQARIARPPQRLLPAPGQSVAGKANVFQPGEGIQSSLEDLQHELEAQSGLAPGTVRAPSVDEAARADYTSVTPPGEPHPGGPLTYDYTRSRPVVTRAANDVNVRNPAAQSTGATAPPTVSPLQNLRQTLARPDIAPYVKEVQASPSLAGADDPTVLQEVYKLMGARQRMLGRGMVADPTNFKAGSALEQADIGNAKEALLAAADPVMPSFREAVQAHAAAAGEQEALYTGADAARRQIGGKQVAGKRLTGQSLDAILRDIKQMTPGEQRAAAEGILGRLGENMSPNLNLFKAFGLPRAAVNVSRVGPLLRASDAGNPLQQMLRAAAGATGGTAGAP